jgi:hypothetical protein
VAVGDAGLIISAGVGLRAGVGHRKGGDRGAALYELRFESRLICDQLLAATAAKLGLIGLKRPVGCLQTPGEWRPPAPPWRRSWRTCGTQEVGRQAANAIGVPRRACRPRPPTRALPARPRPAAAAAEGAAPPLGLHLRVRVSLPGGVEALGPQQLRAALDAYRAVVGSGLAFEVQDAVVATDGTKVGEAAGGRGCHLDAQATRGPASRVGTRGGRTAAAARAADAQPGEQRNGAASC